MKLGMEPKPVLVLCLNSAWVRVQFFHRLEMGQVNRASRRLMFGGGKGVNCARALRCLGVPHKIVTFKSGDAGELLAEELGESGVFVDIKDVMRSCQTLVDEASGVVTELIEPSPSLTEEEGRALLGRIEECLGESGAVACCGSAAAGLGADFMARIAAMAEDRGVPFLLDAVEHVEMTLRQKVDVLKINGEELGRLAGCKDVVQAGQKMMASHGKLGCLAVTCGGEDAYLFQRRGVEKFRLPKVEGVINPIGAGDCAMAVLLRRLAEGTTSMRDAFAEALACASASCRQEVASQFDLREAGAILDKVTVEEIPLGGC